MDRDQNKLNGLIILTAFIFVGVWLVTGCSNSNPVSPAEVSTGGDLVPSYPPLTGELLQSGPAAGFRFFSREMNANLDDPPSCDSLLADGLCRPQANRTITLNQTVQLVITQGDVGENVVISAVAPNGCFEIVDFYPHPYQFSGPIEIHWMIGLMGLPEDFDYSSLVPFYVTDDGVYEEMPHEWTNNYQELIVHTDHFSRYVVAQRISG